MRLEVLNPKRRASIILHNELKSSRPSRSCHEALNSWCMLGLSICTLSGRPSLLVTNDSEGSPQRLPSKPAIGVNPAKLVWADTHAYKPCDSQTRSSNRPARDNRGVVRTPALHSRPAQSRHRCRHSQPHWRRCTPPQPHQSHLPRHRPPPKAAQAAPGA